MFPRLRKCCKLLTNRRPSPRQIAIFLLTLIAAVIYCEYILYYVVIGTQSHCSYPTVTPNSEGEHKEEPLKVMFMADTHLIGEFRGHPIDKFRREWHMRRSFQTLRSLLPPQQVFALGDLFDEGQWGNERMLLDYIEQFRTHFELDDGVDMNVLFGNHDLGFHYVFNEYRAHWFLDKFDTTHVHLLAVKDILFVLITSMGLEGDECDFCREMRLALGRANETMQCMKEKQRSSSCKAMISHFGLPPTLQYSRPILLQHFPLYRKDDTHCEQTNDAMVEPARSKQLRMKWDCVSEVATNSLLDLLQPRAVFSGHTHYACQTKWPSAIEHSVASFSPRNVKQPSVVLATVTPHSIATNSCMMPTELGIVLTYVLFILCGIFLAIYDDRRRNRYVENGRKAR